MAVFHWLAGNTDNRLALLSTGQIVINYQQLRDYTQYVVGQLRQNNIAKNERVVVAATQGIDMAALCVAVSCGAICAPLNLSFTPYEMDVYLQKLGAKTVIVTSLQSDTAKFFSSKGLKVLAFNIEEFLDKKPDVAQLNTTDFVQQQDVAFVLQTSGTTTSPLLVSLSAENICYAAQNICAVLQLTCSDRCLAIMPFIHIHGLSTIFSSIVAGASVVCLHEFSVENFYGALTALQPTWCSAAPTMYNAILQQRKLHKMPTHSLRFLRSASAPMPIDTADLLEKTFAVPVIEAYGMTEAAPQIASNRLDCKRKQGSVGQAAGPEIAIVDGGVFVAANHSGEIVVRGQNIVREENYEASRERWLEGGWLRTGDYGFVDAENYLFVTGRIKDIINRGGEKILPTEVDNAILRCTGVEDAACFAIAHETLGETIAAAVVVKNSNDKTYAFTRELRSFIAQYLAHYKIPQHIIFVEEIPRKSGKIRRSVLSEKYQKYMEKRNSIEQQLLDIWRGIFAKQVRVHDNFFQLGGDSLTMMSASSAIYKEFMVELSPEKIFAYPTIAELTDFIMDKNAQEKIPNFSLSPSQKRLWFIEQKDNTNGAYNVCASLYLHGPLEVTLLQESVNKIRERHSTLRTSFHIENGKLQQHVADYIPVLLEVTEVDVAVVEQQIFNEARLTFDLGKEMLLRTRLLRLRHDEHILLITMHHIISDGWSVKIFFKELAEFYHSLQQGSTANVAPLDFSYRDFVMEQQNAQAQQQYISYWQQQANEGLDLPVDFPRPKYQTYTGKKLRSSLSPQVFNVLKSWSSAQQTTLFTTFLASFYMLLFRYSAQKNIIVGTPSANRDRRTQSLIGFCANTLVLKAELDQELLFTDFVKQVQKTVSMAHQQQHVPLEKLIEELKIDRDPGKPPLFQVMFAFQSLPQWQQPCVRPCDYPWLDDETFRFASDVVACPVLIDNHTAKFDLTLYVVPGTQPKIIWQYNSQLFSTTTIENFNRQFLQLLQEISANPKRQLREFPLHHQHHHEIIKTQVSPCAAKDFVHAFEQQVQRSPQQLALQYNDVQKTYEQVNREANAMAHYLIDEGIQEQDVVGVLLDRCCEAVVVMLAIFKVGAVYLPLDPKYPQQRLDFIINDAAPQCIVTHHANVNFAKTLPFNHRKIQAFRTENLSRKNVKAAYIIYTSGSTGHPKGAIITHENLRHYIDAMLDTLGLGSNDKYLCTASLSFSSSIRQLLLPLCCGGSIVMASREQISDPQLLLQLICSQQVTVIDFVASYWRGFIQFLESKRDLYATLKKHLRLVLLASEALSADLVQRWHKLFADNMQVINMYGQTETTGIVATYKVPLQMSAQQNVAIGTAIPHTQVYVLDAYLQPALGVGEIYIGGPQIMQGYVNLTKETQSKFVDSPFGKGKLYRTGDLAKYRHDGIIEFYGRSDDQIKIRGFRCQPQEIVAALLEDLYVENAVVVPYQLRNYQKIAVAVVSKNICESNIARWRTLLQHKLPSYMVPTTITQRKSLPMTANGKIDMQMLRKEVTRQQSMAHNIDFATTTTEKILREVWEQVLQTNNIGMHDNFFDLGGDSIVSIEIFIRATEEGLNLQLKDIFQFPNIKELAAAIDARERVKVNNTIYDESVIWVNIDDLHAYSVEALMQGGLCREGAVAVTDVQLESSLREQKTHNIGDIPRYAQRLKNKILNPNAQITVVSETAVSVKIDGDNAPGQWVATVAMKKAIAKAQHSGIGIVGVCRSNHFGAAGHYAWLAACENLIGLCTTNGPVILAPTGGTTPTFGNNPFAAGIPTNDYFPIVLDIAMSVAPRGKIGLHLAQGKPLQPGWILDRHGRSSVDIKDLAAGLGVPIGEHKGYGLALVMEILAGALTGAGFCSDHNKRIQKNKSELDFGHFFIALDPELFMPVEQFKSRVADVIRETKNGKRSLQNREILIPGEAELRARTKNVSRGVPLPMLTYNNLVKYGKNNDLSSPLKPLRAQS